MNTGKVIRPAGLLAWIGLMSVACTSGPVSPEIGPIAGCAEEAERLLEPILVRAAPDRGAALVTEVAAGRLIYRCAERRGEWQVIQFPEPDEPVDCSHRSPPDACRRGWIEGEATTESYG
jgi:hypothetical protein